MMYQNEDHERRIIETDYNREIEELGSITDPDKLREFAKQLANDLRVTRDNLADWRWGHLTQTYKADKEVK